MGAGASADASAKLPWPSDFKAILYPGVEFSNGIKLAGPLPCTSEGLSWWELGGPSKARLRVVEDAANLLKLGSSFTVGLCCRAGRGDAEGYDSLLLGNDSKHWVALHGEKHTLLCVEGDSGNFAEVDSTVGREDWVQIFLKPTDSGGTAVLSADNEGLVELGTFPTSLVGSKLTTCGWATNEVQIAAIAVWDRCIPWAELSAALAPKISDDEVPAPLPEPARPPTTFQGRVTDLQGRPLPEVSVCCSKTCIDFCMCGCCTDEDGCFSGMVEDDDAETDVPEDGASTGSASSTSSWLSFTCDGFAPHKAPANAGMHTPLDVKLRPISASITVDAAEGGNVVDPASGSSLTVPPNSLVYPDGSPATGPITVSLSVIDVNDPAGLASMPGDFSAISADGSTVMLQSLGAAWINAADEAGQTLEVNQESEGVVLDLQTEATATAGKLESLPEMWSFNELTGKWELEPSAMKLDGEPAPNVARPAGAGSAVEVEEGSVKYYGKKKGKRKEDYDPTRTVGSSMSAETFMTKIAQEGKKSISAPVKKMGYINCDIVYHSPTSAVMLKGLVLDSRREPMPSAQMWSSGRDYKGRCADITGAGGRFGSLIAQFDSEVDVEVHYGKPVNSDDKVEVHFDDPRQVRKLTGDLYALISEVPGQYVKDGSLACNGQPGWLKKQADAKNISIVWNKNRRRWENQVDGKVAFYKVVGDEADLPFGSGWSSLTGTPIVPNYTRAIKVLKQTFGPFRTGPAGELVDIGELVTEF